MPVILFTLFAPPASAQDWAKARLDKSPRHQEWVKVKQGARTVNAFIVYPEVKNKATAVVVIHEIFGMSDWVRQSPMKSRKQVTSRSLRIFFPAWRPAAAGLRDFNDNTAIGQTIRDLPPDQITADLNAVADYVSKLRRQTAKSPWADSAGAARRHFVSRRIVRASPRRLCFMAQAPMTRQQSRRSKPRCTASMAALMRG